MRFGEFDESRNNFLFIELVKNKYVVWRDFFLQSIAKCENNL